MCVCHAKWVSTIALPSLHCFLSIAVKLSHIFPNDKNERNQPPPQTKKERNCKRKPWEN